MATITFRSQHCKSHFWLCSQGFQWRAFYDSTSDFLTITCYRYTIMLSQRQRLRQKILLSICSSSTFILISFYLCSRIFYWFLEFQNNYLKCVHLLQLYGQRLLWKKQMLFLRHQSGQRSSTMTINLLHKTERTKKRAVDCFALFRVRESKKISHAFSAKSEDEDFIHNRTLCSLSRK